MKTILVPTDFSPTADNAISFAAELNKIMNCEIVLFHAYEVPMPITDVPTIPSDAEFRDSAESTLSDIAEKFKKLFPATKFNKEIAMGHSNDEIIRMEDKSHCDMVVMGSYGDDMIHHLVAGKHISSVITRSACPVLVIPGNVSFQQMNKIMFAVNFGADDYINCLQVIDFAKVYGSEITILHVISNETGRRHQQVQIEKFKERIIEQSGYTNIKIQIVESEHVFEGINTYLEKSNADLLVIGMRKQSLLNRIFNRSLTKKLAYHGHIPLMVLHTALE